MNRFRAATLALGAVTVLTMAGLPGRAVAETAGGMEHITIVATNGGGGPVLAGGAFNAAGTDVPHGNTTDTFKFPKGNINVTHTNDPGGTFQLNRQTCIGHFTQAGDYHLTGGTGAYSGIEGHGTFALNGTLIFAHTPGSAHPCSRQPIGQLIVVHAQGPVSFDS
jgi:hypothetical protein